MEFTINKIIHLHEWEQKIGNSTYNFRLKDKTIIKSDNNNDANNKRIIKIYYKSGYGTKWELFPLNLESLEEFSNIVKKILEMKSNSMF
jgi:hypothetical protein